MEPLKKVLLASLSFTLGLTARAQNSENEGRSLENSYWAQKNRDHRTPTSPDEQSYADDTEAATRAGYLIYEPESQSLRPTEKLFQKLKERGMLGELEVGDDAKTTGRCYTKDGGL